MKACIFRIIGMMLCLTIGFCVFRMVLAPKGYEESELKEMGIPESLIGLYLRNEEARDFVLGYDLAKEETGDVDVSREIKEGEIPFFLQWDERWGYAQYGDDFMAVEGCGPTCLSMVYCGLTGDSSLHPLAMARLAEEQGYYVSGVGSAWTLMSELPKELGLDVEEVLFMADSILDELRAGHPIICTVGPGAFTTSGHFIVLVGADEEGNVTVYDPNSIANSEKKWDVETIMSQTENLWSYRY